MQRNLTLGAALVVAIAAGAFAYWIFGAEAAESLDESSFYNAVAAGQVTEVTLTPDATGYEIRGTLRPDQKFTTYVLEDQNLSRKLRDSGVLVSAEEPGSGSVFSMLVPLAFVVLAGAVFIFFMRRMQSGGKQLLSLGKSRAKLSAQGRKVTFADVAGVEEAKLELQEIIEFLKEPEKFQNLGGKIPTGVLLMGPTGTGKTLLARAVAGEADVPFFSISGSEFVEMFVGIGASRVRDLFEESRKAAPCIVFVDEIDAVGRQRGTGVGGGHDEREQTLNQLLVELDGFDNHDGVIVLAATNRPDVLDPALLRPGRFDREVVVDRPDVRGREQILRIHVRKVPLNADVELDLIARGTPGFSGADLANLVNEAALHAAGKRRETVTQVDLEGAKDKVLMGRERLSLVINDEEKRAMAYHEAGHALLTHLLAEADPLHKVTIIPRGRAMGTTQQIPVEDRHTASMPHLLAQICSLMGGRVSEELQLNRFSTGASGDFEQATNLARKMVTEWGMSERLGPLAYGKSQEQIFLGKAMSRHRDYSEATAVEIDREVERIVMGCYDEARRVLGEQGQALNRIAEALLVHETLSAEQVESLVLGEPLRVAPETSEGGRVAEETESEHKTVGKGLPLLPDPRPRPA